MVFFSSSFVPGAKKVPPFPPPPRVFPFVASGVRRGREGKKDSLGSVQQMEDDAYGMGRRGKGRRMKRDPVPNETNTQHTSQHLLIELLLSIWSPSLFANVGAVIPDCPWDGSLSVITPSLIVKDAAHHDQVQHQDQDKDKDKGQGQDQHRYSAPAGGLAGGRTDGGGGGGGCCAMQRLTCWYVLVAGTARSGSTFRCYMYSKYSSHIPVVAVQ